jgi:hypothetical protein
MHQRIREGSNLHSESRINNWETDEFGSILPISFFPIQISFHTQLSGGNRSLKIGRKCLVTFWRELEL